MFKTFLILCLLLPLSLWANNSIICTNNDVLLQIKIEDVDDAKKVFWKIMIVNDESSAIAGSGPWQKETNSLDAFSSFDEVSAISYKNQSAVFVVDNSAIYFPSCSPLLQKSTSKLLK